MSPNLEAAVAGSAPSCPDSNVSEFDGAGTISTQIIPRSKAAKRATPPTVGDTLYHFELIEELGRGAFSRVFLAAQSDLAGRMVAVKVSQCSDGEPQRLARLQHANIVPIYSVHEYFQFQIVCMPYVGSHTLATLLKHQGLRPHSTGRQLVDTLRSKLSGAATRNESQPAVDVPASAVQLSPNLELLNRLSHVEAVLWIVARLADGLSHAHERGILHCDLKPQNVLLSDDGQPMLLDFNVSLDSQSATKPGYLGGTVPYMAPEHLQALIDGNSNIDPRADLYSLGVILFQLLTGHDPHDIPTARGSDTPFALLNVRRRKPDAPSRWNRLVSPAVDGIVMKLLAPDREQRYACAAHLREDLERHLADKPLIHAANRSKLERMRKWRRRNPRLAVGLAVAAASMLLLVLPATVLAVRQDQAARRQLEMQTAEAFVHKSNALDQVRTAQILLSTQLGNRELLDQGFAIGKQVLSDYGIGRDPNWSEKPDFRLLSSTEQNELRNELGEMLLLLSRGELLRSSRANAEAVQAAMEWNRLAEECLPAERRPRWLAEQRADLLSLAPGIASPLAASVRGETDDYHDGLNDALRGRFADALAKLIPFTDRHSNHFMGWFIRGICHDGLGQMADAAAAFTVCASLRPLMPWPHFNRGLVRLQQKQFEAADGDFSESLQLKPHWTAALINRAIARERLRHFADAENDLSEALDQPDAPTRIYFLRSRVRAEAGDSEGAKRDAAEGMKRAPTDSVSWVTRGVWRMDKAPADALKDFDQALKLDPRSRDALQNKAVVLAEGLRQPAEAAKVFDRLLDIYPAHIEARAGRGVYRARAGDAAGARDDSAVCLRDDPSGFRYYQMAGLHAQLSRHESGDKAKREAFHLLALALRNGFADLELMEKDTDLDPIRATDEYGALVAHARALQRH